MPNNIDIIGEVAALRQLITGNFTETNGILQDEDCTIVGGYRLIGSFAGYEQFNPPITKIILPNATEIRDESIRNHSQLKLLYLGKTTTIKGKSLDSDTSLVTIVLPKTTVCSLASTNAFGSTKYATSGAGGAYIYVPRDLISTYQAATNWATLYAAHSDMFRPLEDYTVDGTTTGEFDEALLETPQTPIYAVSNADVSPNANNPRTITTTAEGHITYSAGTQTSEAYSNVYINNTSVSTTQPQSFFTIPAGSTVKVVIKNMTATYWSSVSGVRNNIQIQIRRTGAPVLNISWGDLLETFQTNGLKRYEQIYTNTSGSSQAITSINLYGSLSSNNVVDFGMMLLIDGVRYV